MNDEQRPRRTSGEAYDELAAAYAAGVDSNLYNANYERPATLSLLPDPRGLRALDAGCGPGFYAAWLQERGARVVAFDASPTMARLTRERLGGAAEVHRADLGDPLRFAADGAFDLVVSALAIDFVADWDALFREFRRVLAPGGRLVFSVNHPSHDARYFDTANYFATEAVSVTYQSLGPTPVPTFRRPLAAIFNPLTAAGFALERLKEPEPTEAFRAADPARAAALLRHPVFLCVRARRAEEAPGT